MAQFWDGSGEKKKKNVDDSKKDMTELGIEVVDFLSNAAGMLFFLRIYKYLQLLLYTSYFEILVFLKLLLAFKMQIHY